MNVRVTTLGDETEYDVPETKLKLVKALLDEVATGVANTPLKKQVRP